MEQRTIVERVRNTALALVLLGAAACASSQESENTDYLRGNGDTTTTADGATTTSLESLPGTVKGGSDAAIAADVDSGLTNCGGLGGRELWKDKPYSPDHMFSYFEQNPAMVDETEAFWTKVMGADALSFITKKAIANEDANQDLTTSNGLVTEFTRKHIANTQVPEGTIEKNHNCVDIDGDGRADTVEFLDIRIANHDDLSTEGNKRTTLAGLVLKPADFEEFVLKMRAAGKNPEDLISYPLNLDPNNDGYSADNERFVFVATNSAICENPVLEGELPPGFIPSTPEGETPYYPPLTVGTLPDKDPENDQRDNRNSPDVTRGSGGTQGSTGATSTTATTHGSDPTTTITQAVSVTSTTLGECLTEDCE